MNIKGTIAALAVTSVAANAAIIATTGFEGVDGFSTTAVNAGFTVTDTSGDYWESGVANNNYTGIWTGSKRSGVNGAVFGTSVGQYVLVNPAGAEGIGTVSFWIVKTGGTSDVNADPMVDIQWSIDGASWTTAETIQVDNVGEANYVEHVVAINQTGDVQVRWLYTGGAGGSAGYATMDDIVITSVPEPSSGALIGLGGIALILRRCK